LFQKKFVVLTASVGIIRKKFFGSWSENVASFAAVPLWNILANHAGDIFLYLPTASAWYGKGLLAESPSLVLVGFLCFSSSIRATAGLGCFHVLLKLTSSLSGQS
jgi:hypothetical protein